MKISWSAICRRAAEVEWVYYFFCYSNFINLPFPSYYYLCLLEELVHGLMLLFPVPLLVCKIFGTEEKFPVRQNLNGIHIQIRNQLTSTYNLYRSALHFYIPSKFYSFGFELFIVIFDFHYFLPQTVLSQLLLLPSLIQTAPYTL